MNETTIFLSQIIGPTFAILGLGMLTNKKFYEKLFAKTMDPNLAYITVTMAMLIIGIAILEKHFLWGSFPEILISFLGIAILVKGAAFALIPTAYTNLVNSVIKSNSITILASIIWLVGGAYLTYVGFWS